MKLEQNIITVSQNELVEVEMYEISEDILSGDFDITEEQVKNQSAFSIYLKDIGRYKPLTEQEYHYYGSRLASGDEVAVNKFIEHNLKLVVAMAKKRKNISPLDMEDLVCAGNFGLINATKTFDYSRNAKFSAHAGNYILAAMIREEENTARPIRLPVHFVQKKNRLNRAEERLINDMGVMPTIEQLSEESGLSIRDVQKIKKFDFKMYSTDNMIGTEGDDEGSDYLCSDYCIESDFLSGERSQLLLKAFSELDEDEKTVVRLRFFNKESHEKISDSLNIEITRVKSIERRSLSKLKEILLDLGIDTSVLA